MYNNFFVHCREKEGGRIQFLSHTILKELLARKKIARKEMFPVYTSGLTSITDIAVSCVHSIVISSPTFVSRNRNACYERHVKRKTFSIEDSDMVILLRGNNKINWKGEAIIKVIGKTIRYRNEKC